MPIFWLSAPTNSPPSLQWDRARQYPGIVSLHTTPIDYYRAICQRSDSMALARHPAFSLLPSQCAITALASCPTPSRTSVAVGFPSLVPAHDIRALPLPAPHMHTDKGCILKPDNSGMSGRPASRTDVKDTSICWKSGKSHVEARAHGHGKQRRKWLAPSRIVASCGTVWRLRTPVVQLTQIEAARYVVSCLIGSVFRCHHPSNCDAFCVHVWPPLLTLQILKTATCSMQCTTTRMQLPLQPG